MKRVVGFKMASSISHVSIIILNWNGWKDTIECLESVLKLSYKNFNVILIDNNSTNDSIKNILKWSSGDLEDNVQTKYPQIVYPLVPKPLELSIMQIDGDNFKIEQGNLCNTKSKIVLIENSVNSGFSRGTNLGIQIGKILFKSDYYFMLNNDTIIEPDALSILVNYLEENQEVKLAQSTIYFYDKSNKIHNTGGMLHFWGQRKYYQTIKTGNYGLITFYNGCAFCVKDGLINTVGYLSEKFFFGEEDVEYSRRLNKHKEKMICAFGSKVYHKIGISFNIQFKNNRNMVFIAGLNKLIHAKLFLHPFVWKIWKYFILAYFFYLMLFSYRFKFYDSVGLTKWLLYYSTKITDVKYETIKNIFNELGWD
jgi:GT2 family glycosyltransferase